jgi:hypothetical protein
MTIIAVQERYRKWVGRAFLVAVVLGLIVAIGSAIWPS